MHLLQLGAAAFKQLFAVVEIVAEVVKLLLAAVVVVLNLVELYLALFGAGLGGLDFLHPLVGGALRVIDNLHFLLFSLEELVLFYHASLAVGFLYDEVGAGAGVTFAGHCGHRIADGEGGHCDYDPNCCHI